MIVICIALNYNAHMQCKKVFIHLNSVKFFPFPPVYVLLSYCAFFNVAQFSAPTANEFNLHFSPLKRAKKYSLLLPLSRKKSCFYQAAMRTFLFILHFKLKAVSHSYCFLMTQKPISWCYQYAYHFTSHLLPSMSNMRV